MRYFLHVGLNKNSKKKAFKTPIKARVIALFLCLVFVVSTALPSYTAYAATRQSKPKTPDALSVVKSRSKLATDAQPINSSSVSNGSATGETSADPQAKVPAKHEEIVSKRTANTKTFDLGNGKFEVRNYMGRVNYKDAGKWKQIDTSLIKDTNAADSSNIFGKAIAWVKDKTQDLHTYKIKANDWQARFANSHDKVGMLRVQAGGDNLSFSPKDANSVDPVLSKKDGVQYVTYTDLWPGVDVVYSTHSDMLKEEIILKNSTAATEFAYDIKGGNLVKNKDGGFDVRGTKQHISELSVTLQKAGPTSERVVSQDFSNGVLRIKLDSKWLKAQASDQFPIVIDPTIYNGPTVSYGYTAYKSDGYVCSSSVCFMNAGQVYDNGWKNWRTVLCTGNISFLSGKIVTYAGMHLQQANRSYLAGTSGDRIFWMQHANSFSYNGMDGGAPSSAAIINYTGNLDMTSLVQFEVNRADWGPCWSMWGEVYGTYTSYKGFDPDLSYLHYEYSSTPDTPIVVSPRSGQTFTDPQVSFQVNPVGDADGDPVSYRFRIATGSDGESGLVIDSGDQTSTQWTVPDGVLQDGTTYYLHVYSRDPYAYSAPTSPIKFTIDMRRGKDKTQTADSVGPISVDLATGDASTSIASHDMAALGGKLGISLDYNSTLRSRKGLVAQYWNNSTQSGVPKLTRVDQNINFNWNTSSYSSDPANPSEFAVDYFSASWTGYFIAPVTGDYQFGGSNDDSMVILLGSNQQQVYGQGCYSGVCYGSSYHMTQGQVVPITVNFAEATGAAYAKMYVKGPIAEQIVPTDWLQTGPRSMSDYNGLTGSYYYDDGSHDLDSTTKQLFVRKTDPSLSFNWSTGSVIPGGPTDGFMARWTGYVSVPATGDYYFGTNSDDGTRVTVNGTKVMEYWSPTGAAYRYGSSIHLEGGVPVPITVDYFEVSGAASMKLYVKGSVPEQIVPSSWLSPSARVLPNGWSLGIDPDGSLNYDRLTAGSNFIRLSDSSGDTHTYTWTGSAYKPPVNEYGQLTRNNDGTYTLADADGKTYTFDVSGSLTSVTMPSDDLNPAALKYEYSGTPAHITKISDGVDSSRYAGVYYYGDGQNKCGNDTSGNILPASDSRLIGLLCSVVTSDQRATYFYYDMLSSNNLILPSPVLERVTRPGNEITDYQYDDLGRMVAIRNSLANDAIAASATTGRVADDSVLTQIGYDQLSRVSSVTAPAANTGDTRQQQTFEYVPYATPLVRSLQIGGNGDHWVTSGSIPAGYNPESSLNASVLLQQLPGNHALYSCKVNWDQFVSLDANCEGQTKVGLIGYVYDTAQPNGLTSQIFRCTIVGEHFVSSQSNCEGFTTDFSLGYAIAGNTVSGQTLEHVSGDTEPNGYSRKVEWDSTFRTVRDTDVTGKAVYQQWDAVKDLLLSTTDATGLMSTTIYNGDDLATDSYGPAPAAWFGADRKPIAANINLVPHTQTSYDEGMVGPAVAYYDFKTANKTLVGAPKLHTTGINATPSAFNHTWNNVPPITPDAGMDGWGFVAIGKLTVPSTGSYSFRIWHDDGARLTIDDKAVIDDWNVGAYRYADGSTTLTANTPLRFKVDYFDADKANSQIWVLMHYNGPVVSGDDNFGTMLKPDYNLPTSSKTYDAQAGDTATKIDYGYRPELSQASTIISNYVAGGTANDQNSTATLAYEPYQTGSLMRKTSKTLPGGNTYTYQYYGATETRANPCVTGSPAVSQAGMAKGTTQPDPDNNSATNDLPGANAPLMSEAVYDAAGRVVATRMNNDPWTCTTYDSRDRTVGVSVPAINGRAGRAVTTNYAVGGNPLVSSQTDSVAGTTATTIDLLGRTVSSTDTFGYQTTVSYNAHGRVSQTVSPKGTEAVTYDDYNRVTSYALDGTTYANVTYDPYSRIASVEYPQSQTGGNKLTLTQVTRDDLQRGTGSTFTFSDGTTFNESLTLNQQRSYVMGYTNTLGSTTAGATYTYDKLGRLTAANVDTNQYSYGFGSPDSSCTGLTGLNSNANRNSNRTSMTINGATTTYCYNYADQLISTSDTQVGTPTYDDHGNTVQLAGDGAPITFAYDASDSNTKIEQGTNKVEYTKSAGGAILTKKEYRNGTLDKIYRYAAGVLISCDVNNPTNCGVVDKYISLPGGVSLTLKASGDVYSIQNFHGDTALTVSNAGLPTSSVYLYDPFGQVATSSTFSTSTTPDNATDEGMGWAASPVRKAESLFSIPIIQMGARVYLPTLGRFLQVDPVEGGTANAYAYVSDPINGNDYSGLFSFGSIFKKITSVVRSVATKVTAAVKSAATKVTAVVKKVASSISRSVAKPAVSASSTRRTAQSSNPGSSGAGAVTGGVSIKTQDTFDFSKVQLPPSELQGRGSMTTLEYYNEVTNAAGTVFDYYAAGTIFGAYYGSKFGGFYGAAVGAEIGGCIFGAWGVIDAVLGNQNKFDGIEDPMPGLIPKV